MAPILFSPRRLGHGSSASVWCHDARRAIPCRSRGWAGSCVNTVFVLDRFHDGDWAPPRSVGRCPALRCARHHHSMVDARPIGSRNRLLPLDPIAPVHARFPVATETMPNAGGSETRTTSASLLGGQHRLLKMLTSTEAIRRTRRSIDKQGNIRNLRCRGSMSSCSKPKSRMTTSRRRFPYTLEAPHG